MKTTINKIWFFILLLNSGYLVQAQSNSSCPNLNFSQGNFTNWVCKTSTSIGRPSTAYSDLIWTGSSPINTRHSVMTNIYGYDSHTCNGNPNSQLSLIPDGFNQSARVGNDSVLYQADAIVYQMTIDSNNALLLLHIAIVFQDPNHVSTLQPYFEIRIQDSVGNLINVPCNRYSVVSGAGIPGFQDCGSDLHWRDWTTIGVSLFSLIGRTVNIVVASADCGDGGHFGYGYIVGECRPMKINEQYCCYEGSIARLEAPEGFVSYVWRGPNGGVVSTNRKLSVLNPVDSAQYTVMMTSAIGCTSMLTCVLQCIEVFAGFNCDSTTYRCFPTGVTLTSASTPKNNHITYWEWMISKLNGNSGTEYVGYDSIFTYVFKDTGYYRIYYTVYADDGCADTASAIVYSYPGLDVKITAPSVICKNTETEIVAKGADVYEWKNVKKVQSDSSAIIDKEGVYIVKGTNVLGCGYDTVFVDDLEFGIRYTTKDNRCLGMDSGEIKITGLIGDYLAPVFHYWEDLGSTLGIPTSERKNLPAGKYFVYSIDDNNCFRFDTIEIKEPLALGAIGEISGNSIVSSFGNYTYSITPVQGASLYHWFADESIGAGKNNLLDTLTPNTSVTIPVLVVNPIEIQVYALNFCDTTDISSLQIQVKTDISEKAAYKGVKIYPNPTSDKLTIQSLNGNLAEIKIFDVVGKEVIRLKINTIESVLDLSNLQNGLYVIWIKTDTGILTAKISKK